MDILKKMFWLFFITKYSNRECDKDMFLNQSHLSSPQHCQSSRCRNYNLSLMDSSKIGRTTHHQLYPGVTFKMKTLARDPPIFEVPNFLTPDECNSIKRHARERGLKDAKQMGSKANHKSSQSSGRMAQTTFINRGKYLQDIRHRVSMLTGIPYDLVGESEPFQVVMYQKGGYYHSHHDSSWEATPPGVEPRPCCHLIWFPHNRQRCTLCRYMTVLLYLNDVAHGGETAFPVADIDDQDFTLNRSLTNLTEYCQRSRVLVTPERGKAVFWYNHHRDEMTGWLGPLNRLSLHGGCDVGEGDKWIANLWINAPRYPDKDKHSIYSEHWK